AAPTVSDAVWVTSTITDDGSVAGAALTYTASTGTLATTTPFTETFGSTATTAGSTWTGTADNTWTVVGTPNPFKLMTSANYTTSSTACGMQFNCSKVTSASLTTSSAINAAGTSGYVEFYVSTTSLGAAESWALQLDSTGTGSSFVTRLSETGTVAGTTHAMTKYHYDLAGTELVGTLKMRFLFNGTAVAADSGRINLDQITVTVTTGNSSTATVAMLDDGTHGDGAAGDHVYGAQIPAQTLGTIVSYYLTATDNSSQIAKDPAAAPTTTYSYTVAAISSNTAPTVATAAWATPNPATGTTTTLGALGADADTGESTLTYTWMATTLPSGATSPTFSANGSNAAKSITATFSKAGTYGLTVTIADPGGLTVTSLVSVTVAQTLTSIAVTPATVSLAASATQQFAAVATDQFGDAQAIQPGFTWASTVNGGTISSGGLFTAPSTSASGTVTATSGAVSGNAAVTVANTAPTVASAASATPSPVTGTTTALTALGADADTGESTLTYTWAATTLPSGATTPSFTANSSNAAKSTTVTFSKAGTYGLTVTIADPGGLTATSSVSVTVAQTLTAIAVTPATASLNTAATQQFSAVANDQFGNALTTQPGFTWASTVTGGTISSGGLFTAPATPASGTIAATSAAVTGSASVTVTSQFHPYTMTALPD
ncbi:MAG: choice-of-anchor X domain-containing protein, partial [Verrucomicrobiota bacterium]